MSDYTKTTDFAAKDALASGNPSKAVVGTEIDDEFNAIATAVATKYDSNDDNQANGIAALDGSALLAPAVIPAATTSAVGGLETATDAEAQTGTATDKIVTPDNLGQNAGMVADILGLTDPGADTIIGWDDSASAAISFTIGTGLTSSGTSITTDDSAIVHDSLSGFVGNEHIDHTSVTLTAGNGLTGGGDISTNRTFNVVGADGIVANADDVSLDISSLTDLSGTDVAATDEFVVYDASASAHKAIPYQSAGLPVQTGSIAKTFVDGDMNSIHELTGSTDRAFTLNTGVGEKGNIIVLVQSGTGSIQIDGTATVNSAVGLYTRTEDSVAILYCLATDTWVMSGDTATS